jgi:hypothetical protein
MGGTSTTTSFAIPGLLGDGIASIAVIKGSKLGIAAGWTGTGADFSLGVRGETRSDWLRAEVGETTLATGAGRLATARGAAEAPWGARAIVGD